MVSRLTPPDASSGTRPATSATASRTFGGAHIVEQQPLGPGGERRLDLGDAVDLDLDLQAGVGRHAPRAPLPRPIPATPT